MQIIHEPPKREDWEHQVQCRKCQAVIEVKAKDISPWWKSIFAYFPFGPYAKTFTCPVCKTENNAEAPSYI